MYIAQACIICTLTIPNASRTFVSTYVLVVIVWMALKRERKVPRRVHLASATKQYAATLICQSLQIAFAFCATEWIAWLSHNQGFILLMSSSEFSFSLGNSKVPLVERWKAFIVDDRQAGQDEHSTAWVRPNSSAIRLYFGCCVCTMHA